MKLEYKILVGVVVASFFVRLWFNYTDRGGIFAFSNSAVTQPGNLS